MTDITASLLYDIYAAMPQSKRPHGVWKMSREMLDRIEELPECERPERSDPLADPPLLLGKPIEIQPDAHDVTFVAPLYPNPPPVDHGPAWAQALSEKLDEIKALLEGRAP